MGICANCNREVNISDRFCPQCGWPFGTVKASRCDRGHLLYETYKSCPVCANEKKSAEGRTLTFDPDSIPSEIDTEVLKFTPPPGVLESLLETDPSISVDGFAQRDTVISGIPAVSEPKPPSPALPSFFAWIVFTDRMGNPTWDFRIMSESVIIGKLINSDIRINDDYASSKHARIDYKTGENAFYISDLGSTNHTWVNGEETAAVKLADGDRLQIGQQLMTFRQVTQISPAPESDRNTNDR